MGNNTFSDKLLDSVGKTYGEYLVLTPYHNPDRGKNAYRYVTAKCSCGSVKVVRVDSLWRGDTKSCGCSRGISCGNKFPVKKVTDHPLYGVWTDMNRRCYSSSRKDYKHYGGRGIIVCEDWRRSTDRGFLNFLRDMEKTFEKGLELERIDTNKNYTPTNCKWVDRKSQVNNTRVNHEVVGYGISLTIEEWNYLLNIEKGLLWDRIVHLGWEANLETILAVSFKDRRWHFKYKGSVYNARELWEVLGYSYGERCRLVNQAGNSVDALLAEGVDFEVLKPREKQVLTFEDGLQKLKSSETTFDRLLLEKISKKIGGR